MDQLKTSFPSSHYMLHNFFSLYFHPIFDPLRVERQILTSSFVLHQSEDVKKNISSSGNQTHNRHVYSQILYAEPRMDLAVENNVLRSVMVQGHQRVTLNATFWRWWFVSGNKAKCNVDFRYSTRNIPDFGEKWRSEVTLWERSVLI